MRLKLLRSSTDPTSKRSQIEFFEGTASPEASQTGSIGDLFVDRTNGALYVKRTGTSTNTGWILYEPISRIQTNFSISNASANQDLTGLIYSPTTIKAVRITFDLQRHTDSVSLVETGYIFLTYNTKASAWKTPTVQSMFDDAGVTFNLNGNQLRYTSSNIAGTNYSGTLRVTDIQTITV